MLNALIATSSLLYEIPEATIVTRVLGLSIFHFVHGLQNSDLTEIYDLYSLADGFL